MVEICTFWGHPVFYLFKLFFLNKKSIEKNQYLRLLIFEKLLLIFMFTATVICVYVYILIKVIMSS